MMWCFWAQTHTEPLHGAEGKQANQLNHRASCQNLFFHKGPRSWVEAIWIYLFHSGRCWAVQPATEAGLCRTQHQHIFQRAVCGCWHQLWCWEQKQQPGWGQKWVNFISLSLSPSPQVVLAAPPTFSLLPRLFSPLFFLVGLACTGYQWEIHTTSSHSGPHCLSLGWLPQHSLLALPPLP